MKLSILQENLSKALSLVNRVVSSRSSLPVLSHVLLKTEKGRLRVSATNLEMGIHVWCGAKIEEEGEITVPARLFSDFINSIPNAKVELNVHETVLSCKTDNFQSNINGISADEFPLIPQIKDPKVVSLDSNEFRNAINQVVFAVAQDETRPVLSGVCFSLEKDLIKMAGTDSYRLAEKQFKPRTAAIKDIRIIIPGRTLAELARILGEAEEDVGIYLSENQISFKTSEVELTSRLIEGSYPDYTQIIPTSSSTSFKAPVDEFMNVMRVSGLFARESVNGVRMEVKSKGKVLVYATTSEIGDNVSSLSAQVKGEDGEISFNARYLQEVLSNLGAEDVEVSISGKLNPCLLKPIKGGKTDDSYLHIVMPLRT